MTFEHPAWLYWTPAILLLFGAMVTYGFRRRDTLLGRFAAARLLDQLTEKASLSRSWIKAACILLAVATIGIALARPQLGVEWTERKARGLDIVFVLDSSKSMLATDLRPTRLARAKLAVIDLVERLESDRIGLVAFAGQAFLQTPPTLDYSAFRESLDAIDPSIMTSGGSDLGNALKEAAEAFPSDNNEKVVVLLTDGEDLSGKAAEAAEAAREADIKVFSIGIGTPEGEYLKVRNAQGIEEFVRDSSGQPVRSQLDETTLQQIAQATGGSYSRLSGDSLDKLYNSVLATLPREERASELKEIRMERFQWALSAAAIFLVLEILIRRRRSAAIHASLYLLAALVISPNDAQAQADTPIEGEPLSSEQTGRPQADTPQKTDARGSYNAAYEALSTGEYDSAIQLYEGALVQSEDLALQGDALYNMGHAAYQKGRATYEAGDPQTALEQIKKAEALFKSAQEIDPDDSAIDEDIEQISKVREAIEKLLEQQKEEQEKQEQEQPDQSEDSEDSDKKGDESKQNQEPQENSDQGDPSQSAPQESTQDPVDDIPQPQPGEESEEPSDEPAGQQPAGAPEPTEGEASQGLAGTGAIAGEPIEGMTEAEAAALLDSLRGKETLLPFIDQKRGGRQRDTRDW